MLPKEEDNAVRTFLDQLADKFVTLFVDVFVIGVGINGTGGYLKQLGCYY